MQEFADVQLKLVNKNLFKYEKIFLNSYGSLVASSQPVIFPYDDLCIILFPMSRFYY